jgi:hypothetical protein
MHRLHAQLAGMLSFSLASARAVLARCWRFVDAVTV